MEQHFYGACFVYPETSCGNLASGCFRLLMGFFLTVPRRFVFTAGCFARQRSGQSAGMDDDAVDSSVEFGALREQRLQLRQAQVMMAGEKDARACRDMFMLPVCDWCKSAT